jgi:hypothetical protein
MERARSIFVVTIVICCLASMYVLSGSAGKAQADETEVKEKIAVLGAKVKALEAKLQTLEDIEAINRLTRAYGYYVDKALWDEIVALWSDAPDCSVETSNGGVYVGKKQVENFFKNVLGAGPAKSKPEGGLEYGGLFNHMIVQGIVDVEPGANTASGRWRAIMMTGKFGDYAQFGEGPYNIKYAREGGKWRIKNLHFYRTIMVNWSADGWAHTPSIWSPPGDPKSGRPNAPSLPPSDLYKPYPETFIPPFPYRNPVTGK